jgi:peptidoglycan/LPS O-acetylase OafA/YrhL
MGYTRRIPSLDGVRGIAAIAVMLFHFNIFFLPQAQLSFVGRAYLSVDLFFLLSALSHIPLIYVSFSERSLASQPFLLQQ